MLSLRVPGVLEAEQLGRRVRLHPDVPVLEVHGVNVTQSVAHLRYAGKKSGLYPTDDLQALRVNEILDFC